MTPARLAVVAFAAVVACGGAPAVAQSTAEPGPIEASREATRWLAFEGRVRIDWFDGDERHTEQLSVRSSDGTLVVKGGRELAASQRARFVYHHPLGWATVWPTGMPVGTRPPPEAKYRIVERGGGPVIAHRATRIVEVRRDGDVWERMYLDADTGLALRREQFGGDGIPRRVMTFETLLLGAAPVRLPAASVDQSPDTVPGRDPSAPFRAPDELDAGYRLVGAYRQADDTVHLLYSDGVYDLSVFEQRGRLDAGELPDGRRPVELAGGRDGWRVAWPGGEVVVWQAGGAVFTAVGEAPFPDVLTAARSMPRAGDPSLVEKLRRVCRSLLDLFG